jgi:hypothetical protein
MLQCVHTQLPIRFGNSPLAMHPFGLDAVQPRTLARQATHHDATAAFLLDATVVRLELPMYSLADMPRGIVPHQQQRRFPFRCQACGQPCKKLGRHGTDWPSIHKAEEHALCVRAQEPIARDRFGLRVVAVRLVLDQAPWLGICPSLQVGLGETAPPDLILKAQNPVGMPRRQRDQPIAPLFFRA